MLLKSGGDYGWPSVTTSASIENWALAPEYGGDGGRAVGGARIRFSRRGISGSLGPNATVHYDKKQFPARYRDGVFVAFHGSWNRAPYPQGGYNIVFQPFAGDYASGNCEIFADGFAGAEMTPEGATHRPSGLAVGPDSALYVADDVGGRSGRLFIRAGLRPSGGNSVSKRNGSGGPCRRSPRQTAGRHSSRCRRSSP